MSRTREGEKATMYDVRKASRCCCCCCYTDVHARHARREKASEKR